jgi:hypothetical protein
MATIKNGILGTISGKIGGLVFSTYRGKQTVRCMPRKSNKVPTDAQLAQQMRLKMTVSFFSKLKTLIRRGYGTKEYISYHLKNAITGIYPDLAIDYSKVILTKGTLAKEYNARVNTCGKERITFTWKNLETLNFRTDDEAILIAYNPAEQWPAWKRTSIKRISETASLEIPLYFSGDTLHCWIAFISADGKQFSNSTYLGTVMVP